MLMHRARRHRMTNGAMHGLLLHEDVVVEVRAALEGRAEAAEAAGVSPMPSCWIQALASERCGPNRSLYKPELTTGGVVGWWGSRKSFIEADQLRSRASGSLVAAVLAMQGGAEILRVHDVAALTVTLSWRQNAGFEIGQIDPPQHPSAPKITETTMSELQSIDAQL